MSVPGINKNLITRYFDPSTATSKGHMVRVKYKTNIQSTHSDQPARPEARQEVEGLAPMQHICSAIKHEIFCFAILRDEAENTIYSNLTGRFPVESYTGMNYIFVRYVYKLNTILLCTTKNREDEEMISAFKSCYNKLNSKCHHPTLHVLNNACSQAVI